MRLRTQLKKLVLLEPRVKHLKHFQKYYFFWSRVTVNERGGKTSTPVTAPQCSPCRTSSRGTKTTYERQDNAPQPRRSVMVLQGIPEILGSNLGWTTRDWDISLFSSVLPGEFRDSTPIRQGSLPSKSFTIHSSSVILQLDAIRLRYGQRCKIISSRTMFADMDPRGLCQISFCHWLTWLQWLKKVGDSGFRNIIVNFAQPCRSTLHSTTFLLI
jgi:hypothetical protein